jgi:hypothetical protein
VCVCVVRSHLCRVEWINVRQGVASGGVIMGGVEVGEGCMSWWGHGCLV